MKSRHYLTRSGLNLAADEGGDPSRPTVILLHGGGQTRYSWGGAMKELVGRGYHVINFDARGHGDSDWAADGVYDNEAMANDLLDIISTLTDRPFLVGASMGGATSLIAVGFSAVPVARGLVLVDVVPRIERDGAERILGFMHAHRDGFDTLEQAVDAVAGYNPHRPRPRDPAGLMKNLRRRDDGRLYWHWDPRLLDRFRHPEPPQRAELLEQAASGVRIPTLLVRGMYSDVVSDHGVAELAKFIPDLEIANVREAGHMVVGDRNDAFNHAILDFLARHGA